MGDRRILPFNFSEVLETSREKAISALSEEDGMLLTRILLSEEKIEESDNISGLIDRGMAAWNEGRLIVTDEGLKAISAYPLFGKKGEKRIYPEAFFPFLLSALASASLPGDRWQKAIVSDFFTMLFPSIPKERIIKAGAAAIERLIDLGVIITKDGELRISKSNADAFIALKEEERLALIIDKECKNNPERLRKRALMVYLSSLLESIDEHDIGKYINLIEEMTGLDFPSDMLYAFSVIENENGIISGRSFVNEETEGFALSSDFSITYTGKTPPDLYLFATPVMADRTTEWKITKQSAKTAFSLGLNPSDILSSLRSITSFPIPETIQPRIELWYSSYSSIRAMRSLLLSVDERNARIIDALPTIRMHIKGKLSDTVFVMNADTETLWRRALANAGFDMLGPTEGPEFKESEKQMNAIVPSSFHEITIPEEREIPFDEEKRDKLAREAETPIEKALALSGFIVSEDHADIILDTVNGLYYQEKMRMIHEAEEKGCKLYAEFTDGRVLIGRVKKADNENISILGYTIDATKIWKVAILPLSIKDLELPPSDNDNQ